MSHYYKDLLIKISKENDDYVFEWLPFPKDDKKNISTLKEKSRSEATKEFLKEIKNNTTLFADNGLPKISAINRRGNSLWKLFPEEFQNKIKTEIDELGKKNGHKLRIRFLIDALDLREQPWEALYPTDEKWFSHKKEYISIVHLSTLRECKTNFVPLEELRILLVFSPEGDEHIKTRRLPDEDIEELSKIHKTLNPIAYCELLNNPSVQEFKDKLKEKWHVIHFLGHGYITSTSPEYSFIRLKDQSLSASAFSTLLSETEVKVIFLSACNTTSFFGYELSKAGIPAVLSMRYKIDKDSAIEGSKVFYESISEKDSVDAAVMKMRKKLMEKQSGYFTPVLFLSSLDGFLFAEPEKVETGNYLHYIQRDFAYTPWLTGKPYSMEEFIPLNLCGDKNKRKLPERNIKNHKKNKGYLKEQEKSEGNYKNKINIEEFTKEVIRGKTYIIKGDPGSGKSTLLRYISYKKVKEIIGEKLNYIADIPIYFPLKYFKGSVIEEIKHYYKDTGCTILQYLETLLKKGKCMLLFDGLDEITENKEKFIELFRNFVNGEFGKNSKIIVSTRFAGYDNYLYWGEHYELMPFEEEEIKKFVDIYFGSGSENSKNFIESLQEKTKIKKLCSTPLLLKLMCIIYEEERLELPVERSILYEKITQKMLEKIRIESKDKTSIYEEILAKIALEFFKNGQEAFTYRDIEKILEEEKYRELFHKIPFKCGILQIDKPGWHKITDRILKKLKNEIDDNTLNVIKCLKGRSFSEESLISGLIISQCSESDIQSIIKLSAISDSTYSFLHLTFQEYFTALALSQMDLQDSLKIIEEHLWEWERWEEVILFLASLLNGRNQEDAEAFLNMLLKHDSSEYFNEIEKGKDPLRNMLFLAVRFCGQTGLEEKFEKDILPLLEDLYNNDIFLQSEAVSAMADSNLKKAENLLVNALKNENLDIGYFGGNRANVTWLKIYILLSNVILD